MKRPLWLSIHAERDLANIFEYTLERWGERQFERYRQLLAVALDQLTMDPRPPHSRAREDLFPGCRSVNAGRHVALYRVGEPAIEVARILHQSMDWLRHIPPEFAEDEPGGS